MKELNEPQGILKLKKYTYVLKALWFRTYTCSKSTTETLEKGVKYVIDVVVMFLIVNFKHVWQLFQLFLLLTLNKQIVAGKGINSSLPIAQVFVFK